MRNRRFVPSPLLIEGIAIILLVGSWVGTYYLMPLIVRIMRSAVGVL